MARQEARKDDLMVVLMQDRDNPYSAELWLYKVSDEDMETRQLVFEAKPLWQKDSFWLYELPHKPFEYWVVYFWDLGVQCVVESEYITPERVLQIGEDLAKWLAIAVTYRDQ